MYNCGEDILADIVGEHIYLSLHFRGTYFHLRENAGFIFGKDDDIHKDFNFQRDGKFRNDISAINCVNIQEIIDLLNVTPSERERNYYQLLIFDIIKKYYNNAQVIVPTSISVDLECILDNCRVEFYKKYDIVKNADRIFYYNRNIVVVCNLNNVLNELNSIKKYVEDNNISQIYV